MVFNRPEITFVALDFNETITASTGSGYAICQEYGVSGMDQEAYCKQMQISGMDLGNVTKRVERNSPDVKSSRSESPSNPISAGVWIPFDK